MPAVSKKQQQFFGIVRAIQKGEQAPTTPETAKAAADMKKSDVKKFASTKHKGLPNKVVQKEELDKNDKPFVKKLVGKLRSGSKTHAKQADDLEKAMNEEGLRAWFGKSSGTTKSGRKVKGWVQVGGKYDGKPCARQPGQKTTPKCVSSAKRRSMSKKERDSAARRKRAADPGQPQKTGAAKPTMVSTDPKK